METPNQIGRIGIILWFLVYPTLRLPICLIDLQNVNITLRILFRPQPQVLPKMYMNLGEDYDERVLPSITTEVLKAVVVSFCDMLYAKHFLAIV